MELGGKRGEKDIADAVPVEVVKGLEIVDIHGDNAG